MNTVLLIVAIVLIGALGLINLSRSRQTPPIQIPAPQPLLDPETLLAPVREQIASIKADIAETRLKATGDQTKLLGELQRVSEQNNRLFDQGNKLSEATIQISTALQGTGVAGDWGELQLQRTVELAGLTENISWVDQDTVSGDEGKLRPDLIVHLPNGRKIVVDAKAPKIDFENSPNAAATQAEALKSHIVKLANKDYSRFVEGAVDFVVLFVPTEGILATALTAKPDLSEFAIRSRILLATPMTLLAMLRSVEYGWKQVAQAENAAHIAKEAAELSDRIATFVDHFNKVGTGLSSAIDNFNKAAGSLERNVKPQARRMRELGVHSNKELADTKEIAETNRSVSWDD
ncbi:MAG: DNA recombination protein RmuC [Actinomycetota bacterium]